MGRLLSATLLLITLGVGACRAQESPDSGLDETIADLLPRLERLSGLTARDSIRFTLESRDSLRAYLVRELNRELPPSDLAGLRGVYRALGLVPDTLDLGRLLLDLYTEQVVGFYDARMKTLFIRDGVSDEQLRPVLAHEIVHALQDQHADIDSLVSTARGNDRQLAAQAALEGQATLVMFRLTLEERLGRTVALAELPNLAAEIGRAMEAENSQFPVFRGAPAIIRGSVIYPYSAGSSFVQTLWRHHPDSAPLDSLLPQSTEQVDHADERFFGNRDEPTDVRFTGAGAGTGAAGTVGGAGEASAAMPGWEVLYENTLGEAEIGMMLRQHLGESADSAARGWDGDRFRLLGDGTGQVLLWVSVWDDAASADHFADAYRRIADERPGRRISVERIEVQGRPCVRIIDADPTAGAVPGAAMAVRLIGGE